MDFGAPVANSANVNPNQAVQTLSGLLSLKQQQQALQTGAFQQQSAAAQAQQEQQTARQRAGLANFMSTFDPTKHIGADGTLDLDSVLTDPKLRQSAGDQFPDIVDKMVGIKQHQLQAKQQLANLNDSVRTQFMSTLGGLRTDPDVLKDTPQGRQKVGAAIEQFGATGPDAARIAQIYGPMVEHAPPGKLALGVSTAQLQAMDAATQANKEAPVLTDTGSSLQNINPQAAGGNLGGQPPITKELPPGSDIVTDAYGRQFRFNRQNNTVEPVGTGSSGASSFQQPVAGQQQVLQDIDSVRKNTDVIAPINRNINQHLLQLSSETSTGPGTQTVQKIAAALHLPSGSDYQTIDAYLNRQAAISAGAMGVPNTNAGLAASEKATGTTEYSPQALQEKVKFADALNSGAMAYRQGLDKAVGTGATPNLTNYQAFRSAWAKNFDPDVYRAEDAQRRGDTAELDAIKKRLGPRGMRELAVKSANLRELENGEIPGG